MPNFLELEQGSIAWLELRDKSITATDIGVLMGISPYQTPFQLWQRKLGILDREPENDAMRRGKSLENEALDKYSELKKEAYEPAVVVHSICDWAMASLDAISQEHTSICEIKCMGEKNHAEAMNGDVKPLYMYQMQWQMFVTDLSECDYFAYSPDSHCIIKVYRDQELIDKMIVAAKDFLECLNTLTPPELTEKDYIDRSNDPYFDSLIEAYMDNSNREKIHKKEKERYRDLLIEYTQDKSTKGSFGKFTRCVGQGRIKYDDIPELKGVDLEQYRGASVISYRVTIK